MSECVPECRTEDGETFHAVGCVHHAVAGVVNVEEKPAGPEIRRMTMDEARIGVARLLNNVLTTSTAELGAALEKDPERDTSNQAHNGKMMLLAAMEFIQGNNILIKRLERPAILRPERGFSRRMRRS